MTDGARTHDRRNHNPELYQLSYNHHKTVCFLSCLAHLAGLEPATYGLEGRCSIQLSYRRLQVSAIKPTGRGGGIRTPDILLPKQARYQAALHPVL